MASQAFDPLTNLNDPLIDIPGLFGLDQISVEHRIAVDGKIRLMMMLSFAVTMIVLFKKK